MDEIKTIIVSLCVSAVIYGVTMILCPGGNMGKTFKTAVGIAVIATIVFSISTITSNPIKLEDFEISGKYDFNYSNELKKLEIVNTCKAYIMEIFQLNNIKETEISVLTNISDDGNIFINEIIIACQKKDAVMVKNLLSDIGTTVNIKERE